MSDMESGPGYANDLLASKLKNLLGNELNESDVRWSYRKAASVLSFFDMQSIKPVDRISAGKDEALESLYPDSQIVYDDKHQPHWTLRSDARRDALKRLQSLENIKLALDSNPTRPADPLQQTLEAYIFQNAPSLEQQSHQDLLRTLQVSEWLNGLIEGVPEPKLVLQRLEIENLLASFHFLVGDHFRGREAELNRLAEYVGVIETGSISSLLSRGYRYVFSLTEKPPLVIYGPGGVGKSTLLAKFILDHLLLTAPAAPGDGQAVTTDNDTQRFPFAYLDFDRASLIAEEPITLLIEAVRQLEIQFPDSAVSLKKLRDSWTTRIASRSLRRRSGQSVPEPARVDNRTLFLDEFADEVKTLTIGDKPLLFVLDTFEEVQYRSRAFVDELFDFLEKLQKRIPTLRTVLSGRAPIQSKEFKTEDLAISIFDSEIAQGFLMSHGISDPELATLLAAQVGGSPLTLKLAVELLRREEAGTKGIKNLKVRDSLLRRLEDGAIQVQLFTRILEHIHDPEVAKLAHPGLVLRRITPELIFKVLAGPCGVEVKDLEQAKRLFEELSREVALVSQAGDNALVHRPDLRKVMLEPLRNDKRDKVDEIHRNAVKYYEEFDDPVSRAEEIYHRLSLGIERDILNERWQEGVQQYLGTAIEELPAKGKAFLAAKLRLEIDEAVWAEADLEDWEIHASQRTRDLLELRQPLQALAALRQRSERTKNSGLPAIEKETLIVALTTMQGYFSTYHTLQVKRATMAKLYQTLFNCLRSPDFSAETLVSVRESLNIKYAGGELNESTKTS